MEVVGQGKNGVEAVSLIRDLNPQVTFLDVQMPGLDGFGVIKKLLEKKVRLPYFVFATAYDNYAVQALGFGIRYRTPIGPFRADFSLSPNSPRFVGCKGSANELLYCGVANPPPGITPLPVVTQRINIFQFHISLGQAF